jgi:hypothetical protein
VRRGYIWGHASLLIDLMPLVTLDERAELVEQALALARTFGQYGDVQKAKLLARIAKYVSPAVKPELNTELRGLARNILQTGVGKRDAWFDLLPKLPVDIQPDSIRDGLPFILDQADRQMTQLFDDLEIASSLKQSVQALLPQLLNALIGNSDATQVQKLLVALQALLPDELGGMVFLRIVDAATLYARWALAMLPFVDRQRDLIIRRIFNILNYNPDAATKAQLFGCLAPHLAEPDRLVVLHQADLALASLLSSPPDKFDTLIELSLLLAPQMSPQFQPGYFALAIGWLGGGIKGGIKDDWQLQRLSTQAATALLAWHNTDPGLALQIIPTWMDFVDHCAIRGRSMLCARLLDFMPWLAVVLPAMAINATTTALIEILQCWPTVPKEK